MRNSLTDSTYKDQEDTVHEVDNLKHLSIHINRQSQVNDRSLIHASYTNMQHKQITVVGHFTSEMPILLAMKGY